MGILGLVLGYSRVFRWISILSLQFVSWWESSYDKQKRPEEQGSQKEVEMMHPRISKDGDFHVHGAGNEVRQTELCAQSCSGDPHDDEP